MKKSKLTLLIGLLGLSGLHAQTNPFQSIGKKSTPMLTLSNGRYIEHFDNDSVRQVGSAMVNIRTGQVVAFVDRKAEGKKPHARTSSRFLSIDPLAASFPYYTPYQYAGNKPIQCVDLDGTEDLDYRVLAVDKNGTAYVHIEVEQGTTSRSHAGVVAMHNLGSGEVANQTSSNLLNQVLGIDPSNPQAFNPNIKGGVGGTFSPDQGNSDYYMQFKQSTLTSTGVTIATQTDEGNYTNQPDQGPYLSSEFILAVPPDPAPEFTSPSINLTPPGVVGYNPTAFANTINGEVTDLVNKTQQSNAQITNITITYPNIAQYQKTIQTLTAQYQAQYPNATITTQPQEVDATGNASVAVEVTGSPVQNLKKE